jgi:hypothetical protein
MGEARQEPLMPQDQLQDETIAVITDRLARAKKICGPWHDEIKRWRDMYNFSS